MNRMLIKQVLYLFLLLSAFLFLQVRSASAADELFLTGIVKNVDSNTRTVLVDVKSASCHGIRKFAIDNVSEFEDYINEKLDFFIDSSTCRRDEVYRIDRIVLRGRAGR